MYIRLPSLEDKTYINTTSELRRQNNLSPAVLFNGDDLLAFIAAGGKQREFTTKNNTSMRLIATFNYSTSKSLRVA